MPELVVRAIDSVQLRSARRLSSAEFGGDVAQWHVSLVAAVEIKVFESLGILDRPSANKALLANSRGGDSRFSFHRFVVAPPVAELDRCAKKSDERPMSAML